MGRVGEEEGRLDASRRRLPARGWETLIEHRRKGGYAEDALIGTDRRAKLRSCRRETEGELRCVRRRWTEKPRGDRSQMWTLRERSLKGN